MNEELNEFYEGEEVFDDIEIITEDYEYESNSRETNVEELTEDEKEETAGGVYYICG